MKDSKTISFSTTNAVAAQIDELADELSISRSALLTAIITVVLKWKLKEVIKNGDRRKA